MRRALKTRGFTLIELMICVAIIGIAGAFMPSLYQGLRQIRSLSGAHTEILRSAQTLDAVLGRDIRAASAVTGRFKEFSSSERCLILEVPRVAAGGRLVPGGGDHIVYSLDRADPARLLKQVFPSPGSRRGATRQVLASNVLSLKFSGGEGAKLVAWEAAFGSRVDTRHVRRAFSSAAALRKGSL
jgi:prepilin-type N-terminal cleavage/methylation domain-containing protein